MSSLLRPQNSAQICVAVGGFGCEGNTVAAGRTGLNDFRSRYLTSRVCDAIARVRLDGIIRSLQRALPPWTRQIADARTPLVIVLDFDANISASMVQNAKLPIGYATYPHRDMRERRIKAAAHWATMHRSRDHLKRLVRSLQMLARAHELEQERGIIAITIAGGFPYSDVALAGPSIVIACDRVDRHVERYADELSLILWNVRQTFAEPMLTIPHAISAAVGLSSAAPSRLPFPKPRRPTFPLDPQAALNG